MHPAVLPALCASLKIELSAKDLAGKQLLAAYNNIAAAHKTRYPPDKAFTCALSNNPFVKNQTIELKLGQGKNNYGCTDIEDMFMKFAYKTNEENMKGMDEPVMDIINCDILHWFVENGLVSKTASNHIMQHVFAFCSKVSVKQDYPSGQPIVRWDLNGAVDVRVCVFDAIKGVPLFKMLKNEFVDIILNDHFGRFDEFYNILIELWTKTGFVHNDLHLGNLMLDTRNENIKMIDYGRVQMDAPRETDQIVDFDLARLQYSFVNRGNDTKYDQASRAFCRDARLVRKSIICFNRYAGWIVDVISVGMGIAQRANNFPALLPHAPSSGCKGGYSFTINPVAKILTDYQKFMNNTKHQNPSSCLHLVAEASMLFALLIQSAKSTTSLMNAQHLQFDLDNNGIFYSNYVWFGCKNVLERAIKRIVCYVQVTPQARNILYTYSRYFRYILSDNGGTFLQTQRQSGGTGLKLLPALTNVMSLADWLTSDEYSSLKFIAPPPRPEDVPTSCGFNAWSTRSSTVPMVEVFGGGDPVQIRYEEHIAELVACVRKASAVEGKRLMARIRSRRKPLLQRMKAVVKTDDLGSARQLVCDLNDAIEKDVHDVTSTVLATCTLVSCSTAVVALMKSSSQLLQRLSKRLASKDARTVLKNVER